MKTKLLIIIPAILMMGSIHGQVSITQDNDPADPSAMLDVQSVSRGFLPPRMTTQQRDGIADPAQGLIIFNTDLNCAEVHLGATGWYCLCPAPGQIQCALTGVYGTYTAGTALTAGEYVTVQAGVFEPGGYYFSTALVNGYRFSGRGTFTEAGTHQVILAGSGTPLVAGTDTFPMASSLGNCTIEIEVEPQPAPQYFRSGRFLHHSTGLNIWGPNGSSTSIPDEMYSYNTAHGYTGQQAVTMTEEWWAPGDNEWVTQHQFFEDTNPVTGIGFYLSWNKIMVIKSCFPASAMSGTGVPGDTLNPWLKSIYNYKWHWRHIVAVMEQHPENFFVIWTNAPLEPYSTNASEAMLSHQFCTWAKDTLAAGLDPEFGAFPPNVYVFDFFHKLTGPDGMMLPGYAAGPGDSHPNAAATQLVAPQFVQEIFTASIGYEAIAPSVMKSHKSRSIKKE